MVESINTNAGSRFVDDQARRITDYIRRKITTRHKLPANCFTVFMRNRQRAETLLRRALAYRQLEEYDKELADRQALLELEPVEASVCNNLAWLYVTGPAKLRDPSKALPLASNAVERSPDQWMYWNTLGVVHYRLQEYPQAVEALERSLREGNGEAAGFDLFFLAMCHARGGDASKAKDYYNRAVKWLQEQQGKLSAEWRKELTEFHAEADAVLARQEKP